MKCPICEGEGGWNEYVDYGLGIGAWNDCNVCDGIGEVGLLKRLSLLFWDNVPVEFIEWYADVVRWDG